MKIKKTFILYEFDQFNNDFKYINEFYSLEELKKANNIKIKNNKSIYHFIYDNIDNIKHLLKDKYIIIKDIIKEG